MPNPAQMLSNVATEGVVLGIDESAKMEIEETEEEYSFQCSFPNEEELTMNGTMDSNEMIQSVMFLVKEEDSFKKHFYSYELEHFEEDARNGLNGNYKQMSVSALKMQAHLAQAVNILYPFSFDSTKLDMDSFQNAMYLVLLSRDRDRIINGWKYSYYWSDEDSACVLKAEYIKSNSLGIEIDENVMDVDKSYWNYEQAVDEFGDAVSDGFIVGEFSGSFSNTTTPSSDLLVYTYFDGEDMAIRLLEYSSTKATYTSSEAEDIILKAKIDDVVYEYSLSGTEPNDDVVLLNYMNDDYVPLIQAIYDGKEVSCLVYIGSSKYNFKVYGDGFAEQYNNYYK